MTLDTATTRALTRAAKAAAAAVGKRDRLIVEAVRDGGGVREVARAVGMNHTSVLHIVRREAARPAGVCTFAGCDRRATAWGACSDHFDA